MRNSERGEGDGCVLMLVLAILGLAFLLFYMKECNDRSATALCLKQNLALEHSTAYDFNTDEAEALAPTVKTKLDELWNAKNKAYQVLEQASNKDRQKYLDEYQATRNAYQCFDKGIRAYGLWPPPEHPPSEATPSAK